MHTTLPHEKVFHAIATVLAAAEHDGLAPVCMALCSPSGHLVHFARMTGAPDRAVHITLGKAKTAALMGASTRALHIRMQTEGLSHDDFCGAVTSTLAGGLPVYKGTELLGGIGVSGRAPDDDEKLAQHCVVLLQEAAHKV